MADKHGRLVRQRRGSDPAVNILQANRMNLQCLTITFLNRGVPNFQKKFLNAHSKSFT